MSETKVLTQTPIEKGEAMQAIALGYVWQVSAANINASGTQGNVIETKKVTMPDGTTVPYVSGQAIRRMIRDYWAATGLALSEIAATVKGQEVEPPVRPWEFIDEDLFGYMDASGGRRRTSPVRVSAAVGLFPYRGDRDQGTRSFSHFGEAMAAGGNMFEMELYANYFAGAMLVELDRIGRWRTRFELVAPPSPQKAKEIEKQERELCDKLPADVATHSDENGNGMILELDRARKIERLHALFDAVGHLWGGGRTARFLCNLRPIALLYARLSAKQPVFVEAIRGCYQDGRLRLDLDYLIEVLDLYRDNLEHLIVGLTGDQERDEWTRKLTDRYASVSVCPLAEALSTMKSDVEGAWPRS